MAKEELTHETILKVAEEIPSLKPRWVIIEGGEPLLRMELFEIIKIIRKGKIKVYLITNGMLLDNDIAKRFAELNVHLMISIEGADKESYERIREGANFEKLKQSVAVATEYNILDACPVTVGKHNYQQIDKLVKFAKEIGYRKITFLGLKPCSDYEKYALNAGDYEKLFFSAINSHKKYGIDICIDEPFFKPFLKEHNIDQLPDSENGIIVPEISRCIFGDYMFIETNGDVKPCTFSPVVMGSVNEKSLDEIWNGIQNAELIKKIRDFSTRENSCKECKYLYECGGCRSRTFGLTKSWTAPDPSCPIRRRFSNRAKEVEQ